MINLNDEENYYSFFLQFAVILIIIFICELAVGIAGFIYKDSVGDKYFQKVINHIGCVMVSMLVLN
jgi:hypothetical protein